MILGTLARSLGDALVDLARAVGARADAAHRRLLRVEADSRRATADDLELLVRAHGLPEDQVWAVVDRLDAAAFDPRIVWAWTMANDAGALAELCASPFSDAQVLRRLIGAVGVVHLVRDVA